MTADERKKILEAINLLDIPGGDVAAMELLCNLIGVDNKKLYRNVESGAVSSTKARPRKERTG